MQQRLVSNEDNGRFEVAQREGELAASEFMAGMKYGHFLKQLALRTSLPVNVLHPVLMAMLRDVLHGDSRYLSEISLDNMTRALQTRINAHLRSATIICLSTSGLQRRYLIPRHGSSERRLALKLWGKCG